MVKLTRPKSFDRFLVNAKACVTQNSEDELTKIQCPTLILGGRQDQIVGPEGSLVLSEKIPGAMLYLYDDYGHALYEEATDFHRRVKRFFMCR